MENPINLTGGEDKENKQSVRGSSHIDQLFEDPFCLGNNQTAAKTESMSQPQLGQRQSADPFSSDPKITTEGDRRARKRALDRRYRQIRKERRMEEISKLAALEAENELLKRENESLKREIDWLNEYEAFSKQLEELCCNLRVLTEENKLLKNEPLSSSGGNESLKMNEKMRTDNPSEENSKPFMTFSGSSEDVGNKHSVGGSSGIARHLQNQDLSIGAQNLLKINQITTETEPMRQQQSGQCQPVEPLANSQEERKRLKSDLDIVDPLKTYWKQDEQKMKSNPETLQSENKCLQKENDILNMFETQLVELGILKNNYEKMRTTGNLSMGDLKFITIFKVENKLLVRERELLKREMVSLNLKVQIQSMELDELRKKFDELKKKKEEQHERILQLEHDIRTRDAKIEDLNDRYIEALENLRYTSENARSVIPLDKSAQQPVPRTNSPGNSDCGSGIGA